MTTLTTPKAVNNRAYAYPLLLFFTACVSFRIASCAEHVANTARPACHLQQIKPNCDPRPPTK